MFRKIITKLYNKYCREEMRQVFLGGIQRDFNAELSEKDEKDAATAAKNFISSHAFAIIINENLSRYVDLLFTRGETEQARDFAVYAINIILKVEESFNSWASRAPGVEDDFDKHEIL